MLEHGGLCERLTVTRSTFILLRKRCTVASLYCSSPFIEQIQSYKKQSPPRKPRRALRMMLGYPVNFHSLCQEARIVPQIVTGRMRGRRPQLCGGACPGTRGTSWPWPRPSAAQHQRCHPQARSDQGTAGAGWPGSLATPWMASESARNPEVSRQTVLRYTGRSTIRSTVSVMVWYTTRSRS